MGASFENLGNLMGTPWELNENILAIDKNTRNLLPPPTQTSKKKTKPPNAC
jgi:hypothetical protein